MHYILLETDWWALPKVSSIVWISLAVYEILADEAFTATDGLISQLFVVAFVHPTYMQIALIWGFLAQLSLWKSIYWLWRYKLNEVCDSEFPTLYLSYEICCLVLLLDFVSSSCHNTLVFLAKPETITIVANVSYYFILKPELQYFFFSLISPYLTYFLSSFYLN